MYTTKQVGEALGLKQDTIKKYIQKGYIEATMIGKTWVISDQELKRLKKKYSSK